VQVFVLLTFAYFDDCYLQQGGETICYRGSHKLYFIVFYRWRATKSVDFIPKFYPYSTYQGRVISLNMLSKNLLSMKRRFDAMLLSNTVIENSDAGQSNIHVGSRFPTPALQ